MPAPPARIREEDFVRLSQLYGRLARVYTDDGRDITPPSVAWHENDLAQLIGRSAWYVVEETNERIEAARAAGGTVELRAEGVIAVHVAGAVTHTLGGLRADTSARVADGIYATGVDVGGVASGGYSSGLAQALVNRGPGQPDHLRQRGDRGATVHRQRLDQAAVNVVKVV